MGKILYGTPPTEHDIDDRVLAHVQVIVMNKFRRNESFPFNLEVSHLNGSGRHALWMHPTIPVQFSFYGSRAPAINTAWVQAMMDEANSGRGLRILPEPEPIREPVRLNDVAA
ncbi:ATP-dependent DNA ligase [Microbacteriaceae bacterium VKM Ac-2855]|nr:ATP-dependent DNA ligase [Microbacteriaceae bacterium VKM Ac-2855]